MKQIEEIEIRDGIHNGIEILEDGELIGKVIRIHAKSYTWKSILAKPPFHEGKCENEASALAHLGYFRKKRRHGKDKEETKTTGD